LFCEQQLGKGDSGGLGLGSGDGDVGELIRAHALLDEMH
jgi:hypothetical protein